MIICVLLFDELFKSINREDVLCDGDVFLQVEHSVGSFPGWENLIFRGSNSPADSSNSAGAIGPE